MIGIGELGVMSGTCGGYPTSKCICLERCGGIIWAYFLHDNLPNIGVHIYL